jgi:hypothetical protein
MYCAGVDIQVSNTVCSSAQDYTFSLLGKIFLASVQFSPDDFLLSSMMTSKNLLLYSWRPLGIHLYCLLLHSMSKADASIQQCYR